MVEIIKELMKKLSKAKGLQVNVVRHELLEAVELSMHGEFKQNQLKAITLITEMNVCGENAFLLKEFITKNS